MRSLLWLLALFALAVGLSLTARFNDGYLLLVLPPYRAEITLNLVVLLLIVVFSLFYGLLRALVMAVSLPTRVRRFRERRAREAAADDFDDAFRSWFAGRYGQALRKAERAYHAGHASGATALLAASAARQLGEVRESEEWLTRVDQAGPRFASARLLLEAQLHLDGRRYAEALASLQQLRPHAGQRIAALRLELWAQQGCGNWSRVRRLLRLLERHRALPPEVTEQFRDAAERAHAHPAEAPEGRRHDPRGRPAGDGVPVM